MVMVSGLLYNAIEHDTLPMLTHIWTTNVTLLLQIEISLSISLCDFNYCETFLISATGRLYWLFKYQDYISNITPQVHNISVIDIVWNHTNPTTSICYSNCMPLAWLFVGFFKVIGVWTNLSQAHVPVACQKCMQYFE